MLEKEMDCIEMLKEAGYKVKVLTASCTGFRAYIIGTSIEDAVLVSDFHLAAFCEEVLAAKELPPVGKML